MKVAMLVNKGMANSIFDKPDLEFLASFTDFNSVDELPNVMTAEFMKAQLPGSVCAVSCWGTPRFDDDIMACAPELKLIAHAAGSVKHLITEKTWRERKCRVTSNAGVIAESVAQTTLAFILTSLGQLWALSNATKAGKWSGGEASKFTTKTLNGLTVGIIGLSLVGREVIKILKPFNCKLLVYDPYVSPFEFESLGVCGTDLNTLLAT
ncbi:MAG: hypothetical protein FWF15_12320, partial [Oscillospiraceae bacterium]|nr:hypothetical protein [Oscillospiraceae bacterium]